MTGKTDKRHKDNLDPQTRSRIGQMGGQASSKSSAGQKGGKASSQRTQNSNSQVDSEVLDDTLVGWDDEL
ncbi:MAG TPA: hypothetical protein VLF93_01570 [Candidatus Saccharimonadales bacterium]|nr:hypothetical protein [Candidatus Saccharimonadales bacterium]